MRRTLLRQALGDLQPIDTVDPGEMLGNGAALVRLQGTYEMPGQREIAERRDLRQCLLAVVFANIADARDCGGANRGEPLCLAHGEQQHLAFAATAGDTGLADAFADVCYIGGYFRWHGAAVIAILTQPVIIIAIAHFGALP